MSLIYSLDENFVDTPDQNFATNRVEVNKGQVEKSIFDIPDQVVETSEVSDVEFRYLKEIGFETSNVPPIVESDDALISFVTNKLTVVVNIIGVEFLIEWGDGTYSLNDGSTTYIKNYSISQNRIISIRKDFSSQFNVKSIDVRENDITNVFINNTTTLESVNFSKNNLGSFLLTNCQNILNIDLGSNLLTQESVNQILQNIYTQNIVPINLVKKINCGSQPNNNILPESPYESLSNQGWIILLGSLNIYNRGLEPFSYIVWYDETDVSAFMGNYYFNQTENRFPTMVLRSRIDTLIELRTLPFDFNLSKPQTGAVSFSIPGFEGGAFILIDKDNDNSLVIKGNNGISQEMFNADKTIKFDNVSYIAYGLDPLISQIQTQNLNFVSSPELDFEFVSFNVGNYFVNSETQKAEEIETWNRIVLPTERRNFYNFSNSSLTQFEMNTVIASPFSVPNNVILQTNPVSSEFLSQQPIQFEVNNVKLAVITLSPTIYDQSILLGINGGTNRIFMNVSTQSPMTVLGLNNSSEVVKVSLNEFIGTKMEKLHCLKQKVHEASQKIIEIRKVMLEYFNKKNIIK